MCRGAIFLKSVLISLFLMAAAVARPCTSAIIAPSATADGHALLWKNRDTSAEGNFLHRVERPGDIGYVGLFNSGDTLDLSQAWMGVNDCGFAVMNTHAYNVAPNAPDYTDREGYVMARALACCRTVDDFAALLDTLPRPLGVTACFGAIDSEGRGAYFEVDDVETVRFDLADAPDGILIRTNYAFSGKHGRGLGHERYADAEHLIRRHAPFTPEFFVTEVSRTYYNSAEGRDMSADTCRYVPDDKMIPRKSTRASVAVSTAPTADGIRICAALGYPPLSRAVTFGIGSVPPGLDATSPDGTARAPFNLEADSLTAPVFVPRAKGPAMIDMDYLRSARLKRGADIVIFEH